MSKEYVMFWKPHESNGVFSQWYLSPFEEDGIQFVNAEQYMMYHKAMLFNDTTVAKAILKTKCPKTMKSLGRKVANFDEDTWAINRERIVQRGNYLKFTQNESLKKFLLKCPVDAEFIEASLLDRIWGIGYGTKNALSNKKNWGLNLLGQAIKATQLELLSKPN